MLTIALCSVLITLLLTYIYKTLLKPRRKYVDIPAVGRRLPFVGNIFDMSKTHLVLTDWAKQYGPIFRFSLFGEEIVVLNDYPSIYEALVTRGNAVAGRPRMSRTDYHDRNKNSVVWQTYTPKLQVRTSLDRYMYIKTKYYFHKKPEYFN